MSDTPRFDPFKFCSEYPGLTSFLNEVLEEMCREYAKAELAAAKTALAELYALVDGECPSLLDDDSGGNSNFALRIEDILQEKP